MFEFKVDSNAITPKFRQVADAIAEGINRGHFKIHTALPSIKQACNGTEFSAVTVSRAYLHLKKQGYIAIGPGNRYFVQNNKLHKKRVLLLLYKLSQQENDFYNGFVNALTEQVLIDIQLYRPDLHFFDELITDSWAKYDHYLLMLPFLTGTEKENMLSVLRKVPQEKLFVLDKVMPDFPLRHLSLNGNHQHNIFASLNSLKFKVCKYKGIVFAASNGYAHSEDISVGISHFTGEYRMGYKTVCSLENFDVSPGWLYLADEDAYVLEIFKSANALGIEIGTDIGLIGLNDCPAKELLGITSFFCDYAEMGKQAGLMLLLNGYSQKSIPYQIIIRKSL